MPQRLMQRFVLVLALAVLASPAYGEPVSRIRLMLHPYAASAGQLSPDALARLQALAGVELEWVGTTRTGGLEFGLPQPLDAADVAAMLKRLREDRGVLWAETVRPAAASAKPKSAATLQGRKLMLRLVGDIAPDWPTVLPRWENLVGMTMTVERQIGSVWVLKLRDSVSEDDLAVMASQLETDPAIQYADPVRRVYSHRVPNDPLLAKQWALSDPVGGVDAATAWDLQTGSAGITVAVIDTGITLHPDLAGRVLPGYDFITDPQTANDGNGRDNDPSDTGDAVGDGECDDGSPGHDSTWHGTFVSGLIAADSDNGVGIAGMDWAAMILPVRALGKCGGSFDDVLDGVLWAAGVPVAGVPANPNPARVINMSLGGFGSCPQAFQDAVNLAMGQGAVIVVSAGNESDEVNQFAPANCSGVITVGAGTRQGDRSSYSNFGHRVDLSAPGGDGEVADWILSLWNDGKTAPGDPAYAYAIGTSFAAPYVAGTVSLMLARNTTLTPGRVLDIVTGTTRGFAVGSTCTSGSLCGVGLLDAGLAVQSTIPSTGTAPPGTVPVVEYYRADKDHYFMTADPLEIAYVDALLKTTFQRTGEVFYAWLDPFLAPLTAKPVCRFYGSAEALIDSHFYSASASECQYVFAHYPGIWSLELAAAFYVLLPDANGQCQGGLLPVYRFFNNRRDANHRHTIDLTVRRAMINRAWVPEGIGSNAVAFCTPI